LKDSIVSDYGLDNQTIGVQSPAGAKDFSSILCVQTGSGAHHPASCPMGTKGPFPGDKARPGHDADHSLPSSAEVVNESELYLLSPQALPWRVVGLLYFTSEIKISELQNAKSKHYGHAKLINDIMIHKSLQFINYRKYVISDI
jgi:hypothetical protein